MNAPMSEGQPAEKPVGVYFVSLYFVVSGFLESIQKYREWDTPIVLNPLSEHSVWHLATHVAIYLVVAYLLWELTWLGRLAGLVYGYLTLATYAGATILFLKGTEMASTPLFLLLALYHVVALIPLVVYLQPKRQKKLFRVGLLEIILPPK
jgi:hypothetical protein